MSLQRQENAAKQRRKTHWSALINGSHKEALTVFHRCFFFIQTLCTHQSTDCTQVILNG